MKKLLTAGIVMMLAVGLFAETLTLTGVLKGKVRTNKEGVERTDYTLVSSEYKEVRLNKKQLEKFEAFVGKKVVIEAECKVKEGKKGKTVNVKKILSIKE